MSAQAATSHVRLAELLAALSLGVDLGFGQPMEHVLRQCLIALRLADRCGLDDQGRSTVYFTSLLITVGCHSDAHEQAKWFGDDLAVKAVKFKHGMRARAGLKAMSMLGAGQPPLHRFRLGLEFLIAGHREMDLTVHLKAAYMLAEKLGISRDVIGALQGAYEHWDGRGWPGNLSRDSIPLPARIAQMAEFVEVAHRMGGVDGATAFVRRLAGRQFDPALVKILCDRAPELLDDLDSVQTWGAVIAAEPALGGALAEAEVDSA